MTMITWTPISAVSRATFTRSSISLTIASRIVTSPCQRKTPSRSDVVVAREERRQLARVVRQQHDRDAEAGRPSPAAPASGASMSPTCSDVMIRLKRRWPGASASASAPDDTRVMPGLCRKLRSRNSPRISSLELAVLRQDERVVEAADQQDVLDAVLRQVLEAAEAAEQRGAGLAGRDGHDAQVGAGDGRQGGGAGTGPAPPGTEGILHQALVHHRVGHLEEAGDVRAVHVVAGACRTRSASRSAALWIAFMMPCSRWSTSSRVQLRRMLFCDISRPEVATPPALAALPGP